MPLGIDREPASSIAEDVRDVPAHVVRAGDDARRRGAPSSARRRGCATAGACRPSPGGGRARWHGRSTRYGTPAARASAAPPARRASRGRGRRRSRERSHEPAPAREHVRRSCRRPSGRTRRGRLSGSRARARGGRSRRRGPPRRRSCSPPRVSTWTVHVRSPPGSPTACARGAPARPPRSADTPRRGSGCAGAHAGREPIGPR